MAKNDESIDFTSLSDRGKKFASVPARIDMELFAQANEKLYDPDHNPHGAFPLNVAENTLMIPDIQHMVDTIFHDSTPPEWIYQYTDPLGHPDVRNAISVFMQKYLCGADIHPDSIAISAGVSATIETTSFILGNPGDTVVIPAPSYPMYTNDLGVKSGLQRYDLQTHESIDGLGSLGLVNTDDLDKAWKDIKQAGSTFRILLITSPDNPTGCLYTTAQLEALAFWCINHNVHMIVNEIYGLSTILTEDPMISDDYEKNVIVESFARIMERHQSDYLHLWYGFSKDFAMSGFRIGVLHTHNVALLQGMGNTNIPHMVSNLTQWIISQLLDNHEFLDRYIVENRKRLTESYKVIVSMLNDLSIPYVPSRGSLFIWVDFSEFLAAPTSSAQEKLWVDIFHNTGVLLTPGEGFRHMKKGMFRIVHSAIPTKNLQIAMRRLSDYLTRTTQ